MRDRALHRALLMLSALLLLPSSAWAAEPSEEALLTLMTELRPIAQQHRGLKGFKPLSEAQLRQAARGEVVVQEMALKGSTVPRVTLATVMEMPIEALYLVIGDAEKQTAWIPQLDHSVLLSHGLTRQNLQMMLITPDGNPLLVQRSQV